MCTVSYIPVAKGYILTSNRDEDPNRVTLSPRTKDLGDNVTIEAPIDAEKGGTWIGTDEKNKTACLMNGGFVKHQRDLPYRKSRGEMIFDAFRSSSFACYAQEVNLYKIEPFTLVLVDEDNLMVLVWDGREKYIQTLDRTRPYLWSSSTLYTREEHFAKEARFKEFLASTVITPEQVLKLHGLENDNLFVLNHPVVKTVSITQVEVVDGIAILSYFKRSRKNENQEVLY